MTPFEKMVLSAYLRRLAVDRREWQPARADKIRRRFPCIDRELHAIELQSRLHWSTKRPQ